MPSSSMRPRASPWREPGSRRFDTSHPMRIPFDQGTPAPLRRSLPSHSIQTAHELGWSSLSNGDLLAAAQREHFDALVTTDKNLRYQQNLADRRIAILVLPTTSWPTIQRHTHSIAMALEAMSPGGYAELQF